MSERIDYLLKLAQPNDIWQQNGMTCFVLHKTYQSANLPNMPAMIRNGHWNGYVVTDTYIPDALLHEVDVYGGVTLNEYSAQNIYGFDTAHVDDDENPKNKAWVIEETQRFADNILQWQTTPAGRDESENAE